MRLPTTVLRHFAGLVAIALVTSSAVSAGVLVVAPTAGAGVDYTSIAAAVLAATDGDIVLVRSGTYASFTVDDKELTITADAGATVVIAGRIRAQFLAPDKRLVVRGLTCGNVTPNLPGLTINVCQGLVWLENMSITGGPSTTLPSGWPGLNVVDSTTVLLVRSSVTGGTPYPGTSGYPDGGHAVLVNNSTVTAYESTFVGRSGAYDDDRGGDGGDGVHVLSGTFNGFWCTHVGGDGGASDDDWDGFCGCPDCPIAGAGGDGIEVEFGGDATLASCSLTPGLAGPFTGAEPMCTDGAPGVASKGAVSQSVLSQRSLSASSPTREGGAVTITIDGVPGDAVILLIAVEPALVPAPQYSGTLLTLPLLVVTLGTLPGGGAMTITPTLAPLPAGLEGVDAFLQAAFATGGGLLGSASQITLLDSLL